MPWFVGRYNETSYDKFKSILPEDIEWAKENMHLCGLDDHKIRFIVDDVIKFLEREKRRGRTYHGIIMDPPSYGRGPNKEVWKLEDNLQELLNKTKEQTKNETTTELLNGTPKPVGGTQSANPVDKVAELQKELEQAIKDKDFLKQTELTTQIFKAEQEKKLNK